MATVAWEDSLAVSCGKVDITVLLNDVTIPTSRSLQADGRSIFRTPLRGQFFGDRQNDKKEMK
jgi:hypothetical protein